MARTTPFQQAYKTKLKSIRMSIWTPMRTINCQLANLNNTKTKPCIYIYVYTLSKYNIVKIAQGLPPKIVKIRQGLPPNIDFQ